MSKSYTVEFDLEEGSDEFWDNNPLPQEVLEVIREELAGVHLDIREIRITKIVDLKTYYEDHE
jgi:hypothetical protein